MDPEIIKSWFQSSMNEYLWWFIATALLFFFKNTIENFVYGVTFYFGDDYNLDEEVLIGGTRRARIVRQTITKTVFYIYDHNTRLVVPNSELNSLRCEKVLPGTEEREQHV